MPRKIVYNNLLAETGESPLAAFNSQRLANQISDARENAAQHAFKVGHPQGMVDVPGKRGWIYMQRMLPTGDDSADSVTMECFVPTKADGTKKHDIRAGDVINPRRTADTNPTYWTFEGEPSRPTTRCTGPGGCAPVPVPGETFGGTPPPPQPSQQVTRTVLSYPCDSVDCTETTISVCEPAQYVCGTNPDDISCLGATNGCAGNNFQAGDTISGTVCNVVPSGAGNPSTRNPPYNYYNGAPTGNGGSGTGAGVPLPVGSTGQPHLEPSANPVTIPEYQYYPPISPVLDQLWYDGFLTRRYTGLGPTGWSVVEGPGGGTFSEYKASEAIGYLYGVYKEDGDLGKYKLATSTNLASYGKLQGLSIVPTSAANKIGVIQSSGLASFLNAFDEGTRLYLSSTGAMTATPPAQASDEILQQVATVINNKYIHIELGVPIIRSSSS